MTLMKDFLDQNGPQLVSTLVARSGFSTGQARLFLPEAVQLTLVSLAAEERLDLSAYAALTGPVIDRIDIERLARGTGISHNEAAVGLARIIPLVIEALDTQYAHKDGRPLNFEEFIHPDQGNQGRSAHSNEDDQQARS